MAGFELREVRRFGILAPRAPDYGGGNPSGGQISAVQLGAGSSNGSGRAGETERHELRKAKRRVRLALQPL